MRATYALDAKSEKNRRRMAGARRDDRFDDELGNFRRAADWNRGKTGTSIEEMAERIVSVIMESAFKPALD
ncbi:hypothetical protein [Cohnella cholangitidis]|uniref:hypothetical protein n=1 Tax=Cohnella cholangitidis TaxID=2598458 RepID=UPI0015FCE1FB|nr:hypothetical protein [Cohnella cholangitidis]